MNTSPLSSWIQSSQGISRDQARTALISVDPSWEDRLGDPFWVRQDAHQAYHPGPRLLQWFDKQTNQRPRLSGAQVQECLEHIQKCVTNWNSFAAAKGYPTIAGVWLWGSVAKHVDELSSTPRDFGDIDASFIWRASQEPTHAPLWPNPVLPALLADDLVDADVLTIKQWVEDAWIDHEHISWSGVDQWSDLAQDDRDFVVRELWRDDKPLSFEHGLSKEECAVLAQFSPKSTPRHSSHRVLK